MMATLIISSITASGKFPKIQACILMIQLILAGLIGVLTFYYIQCAIGDSTNLSKIINGYDHDVLQDLLRAEGTGWTMIKSFISLVTILYLFLGPFIMGGLFHGYSNQIDGWKSFWKGGSMHYWRFFRVNALALFLIVVILGLLFFLGSVSMDKGLKYFISEIPVLSILAGIALLFLVILSLVVPISTKTKWSLLDSEMNFWTALRTSIKAVKARWIFYIGIGLSFLLLSIAFAFVINFLINLVPESNVLLITLAILLQLAALYIRIWLRNSYYHALVIENT